MGDRLPGSSWSNPIWYRGDWRIYLSDFAGWEYVHDDFDGAPDANDHRCGHARTVEDAKRDIDAWHEENDPEPVRDRRACAAVVVFIVLFWVFVAYWAFG